MNSIKIKFTDFWEGFDPHNNFIINSLKKSYSVEITDTPDILFYSCFGSDFLKFDCVRIFYTGENVVPDFRMCDYAIGFEYMTYGERYLRFPLFCVEELYGDDCRLMLQKHKNVNAEAAKRVFCAWVVSNAHYGVTPLREQYYRRISEYKKIDSGGRYLNNIGITEGITDKLEFQKKHKFALAIENSFSEGYVTEKIVQAYAAGTVPIYCGDFRVSECFNPDSFININSFESIDEAVDYIEKVDSDDELYLKMLSTPALIDAAYVEKCREGLDAFLKVIVDKPIERRFKRDRYGRNSLEEREYKLLLRYRRTSMERIIKGVCGRMKRLFCK